MNWKKLNSFKKYQAITPTGHIRWKIKCDKVYYGSTLLKGADTDSFEIPENIWQFFDTLIARDKNYIYYGWSKVKKIDRDSFEYVGDNYWKDSNNAYVENETSIKPLKGLDIKTFNYLGNGFSFDKNYAYYWGVSIKKCKKPLTLEIVKGGKNTCFAKDEDYIYYKSAALKCNKNSWVVIDDFYSSDDKSVFYMKDKLPRVDLASWEYLGGSFSKDKNKVYCMNFIEENALPKEWDKERVIQHYKKKHKI